tara:strand:+ start:83 stop:205 length:123 start_codon:yes stop_codon:yes gene_type:complete
MNSSEKKDSFTQERKNALKKNLKKRKKYKKVKKKYASTFR